MPCILNFLMLRHKYHKKKDSMMWLSQNFLLYNVTVMKMIEKEKFKLEWQSYPLCDECTMHEL